MEDVSYEIEGKQLLKDFSTTILRSDKIALLVQMVAEKPHLLNFY